MNGENTGLVRVQPDESETGIPLYGDSEIFERWKWPSRLKDDELREYLGIESFDKPVREYLESLPPDRPILVGVEDVSPSLKGKPQRKIKGIILLPPPKILYFQQTIIPNLRPAYVSYPIFIEGDIDTEKWPKLNAMTREEAMQFLAAAQRDYNRWELDIYQETREIALVGRRGGKGNFQVNRVRRYYRPEDEMIEALFGGLSDVASEVLKLGLEEP